MPDWKKKNFAWEIHRTAENTKEILLHPRRFVQSGAAVLQKSHFCLDVAGSTEIQSCFANTLLQSHGITEGDREQRSRNSRHGAVRV